MESPETSRGAAAGAARERPRIGAQATKRRERQKNGGSQRQHQSHRGESAETSRGAAAGAARSVRGSRRTGRSRRLRRGRAAPPRSEPEWIVPAATPRDPERPRARGEAETVSGAPEIPIQAGAPRHHRGARRGSSVLRTRRERVAAPFRGRRPGPPKNRPDATPPIADRGTAAEIHGDRPSPKHDGDELRAVPGSPGIVRRIAERGRGSRRRRPSVERWARGDAAASTRIAAGRGDVAAASLKSHPPGAASPPGAGVAKKSNPPERNPRAGYTMEMTASSTCPEEFVVGLQGGGGWMFTVVPTSWQGTRTMVETCAAEWSTRGVAAPPRTLRGGRGGAADASRGSRGRRGRFEGVAGPPGPRALSKASRRGCRAGSSERPESPLVPGPRTCGETKPV